MKPDLSFVAIGLVGLGQAVDGFVATRGVLRKSYTDLSMSDISERVDGFTPNDLSALENAIMAGSFEPPSASGPTPLSQLTPEMIEELKKFLQSDLHPFEQDSYWKDINKHVTEATTMPPEAFRSTEFYNVERRKLFEKTWQVAAFTDQLRKAGDVVSTTVAGQPVILTRARDGEIRAFLNVCRHRGARLVKDAEACGKKGISCPYHNWGYSLDGRLMGTPLWNKEMKLSDEQLEERLKAAFSTEDVKNFKKEEFGLLPVRVEKWGPFIYANLSGDAPPIEEYLGRVTEDLELYPFDDLVTVRQTTMDIKANWKLLAENFLDFYHVPTVHPGYCEVSRFDDHDRSQGDGAYMCHITYPLTNAGSALDLDRFPNMPGLKGTRHEKTGWFHLHFPNMFYFLLPHSFFVVIIEPTGPTTSTEHVRLMAHKDSIELAGEGAQEALQGMWEAYIKVNTEDYQICEECQIGANAEAWKGGRMAWTLEESLNRFHKMVANCMTGKPHIIPEGDKITSAFDKIPIQPNNGKMSE